MTPASASRPRLLILTSTLPRWEGDCEPRFVLDLAIALSDRFDSLILAPMAAGAARRERLGGIAVERFSYAPVAHWQTLAAPGAIMPNLRKRPLLYALVPLLIIAQFVALVRILRRERFDLVHCHWLVPQGLVLALAGLLVRVPPALVTCHGADAFTLEFPPFGSLKRWVLRRAGAITVVSREIADHLKADPAQPLAHIPMGVDLDRFAMREPQGAASSTILFVGRLAAKKGVDKLLRALADVRLAAREVQLRVIGDGPLRDELERLSITLGLSSRVTFVGSLPHDRLVCELHKATLLCAPFVVGGDGDREGTPTVLLEAAACGIPIITSDVGGCRDVVMPGQSGWLLRPGDEGALADAIVEALADETRARAMAARARIRAEDHGWSRIAEQYANVLHGVWMRGKQAA